MSLLSDITIYTKYARYIQKYSRRESWNEIIDRVTAMHVKKYPELKDTIISIAENEMKEKKILPSMRSLQFAGAAIDRSHARIYNCAYLPVEHIYAFSETMWLLLGGTGVGLSFQQHHIDKLPPVFGPKGTSKKYLIDDSIEGWADAVKVLIKSYFLNKARPIFDFSQIREKGMPLITSGGKAPGPQPLKRCLANISILLDGYVGRRIDSVGCCHIMCYIADAVLAGGIRRAALAGLFSPEDMGMMYLKSGAWYETSPELGRINLSAVLLRGKTTYEDFDKIFTALRNSGSGEPGFFWVEDLEQGTNPCFEIKLRPYTFCNLVEVSPIGVNNQGEFNKRAHSAAVIATLQAGYTDFHYLRDEWKKNTEEDSLIGVGLTGVASGNFERLNLSEAANIVKETNRYVASLIGINPAKRCTTIKPSGTSSLVLGTSSGIHDWFANCYVRRIQYNKNEPFIPFLMENLPSIFFEESLSDPVNSIILKLPVKAPVTFEVAPAAIDLLERVRKYNLEWIREGTADGGFHNNVSCTVNVLDSEWDAVEEWMWDNRDSYNGIALFPKTFSTYQQLPFEEISDVEYYAMLALLPEIDLTDIIEKDDNTSHSEEIACGGGACEI